MRFLWTTASKKALEEIKARMIIQHNEKNINRFRLKFTKKKEFLAIPVPFTDAAFQLFINGKFYKTYFYQNKKWKEIQL